MPCLAISQTETANSLCRAECTYLLVPLIALDFQKAEERGISLREARHIYWDATAATAMLASIMRRFVWRDLVAPRESANDPVGGVSCPAGALQHAVLPLPCGGPRAQHGSPRGRQQVSMATPFCFSPKTPLAPAPQPGVTHRYVGHDMYGLAAGLAASWADLAADTVQDPLACTVLAACAGLLQRVRSPRTVCGPPPCTGCRTAGAAPRRRSKSGHWRMSQRRGPWPLRPGPPSWRRTTATSPLCTYG